MIACQSKIDKSKNIDLHISDSLATKILFKKRELDTLLNTNKYLILGNKVAKVKVVTKIEVENFPTFKIMVDYLNDVIIAKNIDYNSLRVYRKYNPQVTFKDFPAEVYKGKLAYPDFSTNLDAKRFITRIKNECANGINFAGHYTLVTWGFGSPCQSGVVVNRKTGEIFGGSETALGSEFKKNSKMIIKNIGAIDTATNLIEVCSYCNVNHEIWTGSEFNEIE